MAGTSGGRCINTIGSRPYKQDADRRCCEVLLELDTPIHRDQRFVLGAHSSEKLAVRDASPAGADHGIDTVALECHGKVYRDLLVKKNAHPPRVSHARGRVQQPPGRASRTGTGEETRPESRRPRGSRTVNGSGLAYRRTQVCLRGCPGRCARCRSADSWACCRVYLRTARACCLRYPGAALAGW